MCLLSIFLFIFQKINYSQFYYPVLFIQFSAHYLIIKYFIIIEGYNTLKISFVVFLIFACGLTHNCLPRLRGTIQNTKINQLQAGNVEIAAEISNGRYTQYRITFKQTGFRNENLNVGLSIAGLQNYSDNTGTDFLVRPSQIETSYLVILLALNSNSGWKKAKINYLASSLSEFKIGSYFVDDIQLLQPNSKIKTIRVPKLVQIKGEVNVYAWIAGLRISDNNFDIKLSNGRVSGKENNIQIPISVSNNKKPIQLLYVSYYVYGNMGKQTISLPSILQNILTTNSNTEFNLLIGVSNSKFVYSQISNSTETKIQSTSTPLLGISFTNLINIGPILTSSGQPVSTDLQTKTDTQKCFTYDQCISQNGIVRKLKNGDFGCVLCPVNKRYNQARQKCVCVEGYISFTTDQCISLKEYCGTNAQYENGSCTSHTVKTINVCQLRQNYVYDASAQKCICKEGFFSIKDRINAIRCSKCPQNTAYNIQNQTCDCAEGFIANGDSCTKCNVAERWNNNTKTCECVSNANRNSNNRCVICSINARFNINKKECECSPNFFGTGIICRRSSITIIDTQNNSP